MVFAASSVPSAAVQSFERIYPFGWLGILADVPPVDHELIYSNHERGFALCSMRSRRAAVTTCNAASRRSWKRGPTARFWDELRRRLPERSRRGLGDRSFDRKKHCAAAKFCGRADAIRAALPGGRCGAHRAADGRQGSEPGGRRCSRAASVPGRTLQRGLLRHSSAAGSILGIVPAPRLESGAFFLVVHLHHAQILRRSLQSPAAIGGTRLLERLDARRSPVSPRTMSGCPSRGRSKPARLARVWTSF